MKKLEQTEDILRRLFDPHEKGFDVYVTAAKKQVHQTVPKEVKLKFWEHYLDLHWQEICGENLASCCCIEELTEELLCIRTNSSILANELYMMKSLLLRKINSQLEGKYKITELKFITGSIKIPSASDSEDTADDVTVKQAYTALCPICHARIRADRTICSVCERELQNKEYEAIVELLKQEPWLTYEEASKEKKLDRILFERAKDRLKNYYFEKVRQNYSDSIEEYMAVMLLTGKNINQLNDSIVTSSLEYLRRNKDVFASRI